MSNTRKKGTCIRGLPQFTICDWDNLLGYALFFLRNALIAPRQNKQTTPNACVQARAFTGILPTYST